MSDPILHTDRLILRPWRDEDLEPFAAINADPAVMEYFAGPLSVEETVQFVNRIRLHFATEGFGFWAVEAPGVAPLVGMVGLARPRFQAHFTPCVEIGWRLARDYWGRGYATEAAAESLRFGFESLRLDEIVAFTTLRNARSRAVMERLGMGRSAEDDFDHPNLPEGHPLRRHVLHRIRRDGWREPRRPAEFPG
ncbi:GNAT family N-acetyltransferase [Aquisphaera insulae]|uniref:GNAT family N-acetyltransferase n=1 Tax=Aquisphaera insulae TaxID=2712864 RepID=UPI0013E9F2E1|nr:GNAT family N-acetyltransferase [Aquisphaera insulae]